MDDEGGILPTAALEVCFVRGLARGPSNFASTGEFPLPESPCATPILAQPVGGATATFLPEVGTHWIACVFQIGLVSLARSETEKPTQMSQPEGVS